MIDRDHLLELLAAIRDQPEDNRRRWKLADWLEQEGDPRGEWIRLQLLADPGNEPSARPNWVCQFSHYDVDEDDRRESELFEAHGAEWLGDPPQEVGVNTRRGMLQVDLNDDVLADRDAVWNWLRDRQPWIESLSVSYVQGQLLDKLAERGLLSQIAELHFHKHDEPSCPAILAQLTQLRALELSGDSVTDEWLEPVARIEGLQSLVLLGCSRFDGSGFAAVADLLELRSLTIQAGWLDYRGLARLQCLEQLKFINHHDEDPDLCDRFCQSAGQLASLQKLQIVDLSEQGVTDAGLRALSRLTQLKSLTIVLAAQADVGLLAALPLLEELKLSGPGVTDDQLARVAQLKSLRQLSAGSKQLTGAGVPALSALERLESMAFPPFSVLDPRLDRFAGRSIPSRLELIGPHITDDSLPVLSKLTQLTELDLHHARITGRGLRSLVDLPLLESAWLHLDQLQTAEPEVVQRWTALRRLNVHCRRGSLQPLSYFAALPQASIALDLSYVKIDETELAHLAGTTQIKLLDLSQCQSVSDRGLEHLAGLTGLQLLNLSDLEITEAGLRFLSRLHDLWELRLGDIPLIGDGLRHLAGMQKLNTLRLNHTGVTDAGMPHLARLTQLQDLDLYRSAVTDAGLVHLTALDHLKSLNLSYSQVTDAAAHSLSQLKRLESLWLDETCLTPHGIDTLQQSLPRCEIRYRPADD